MKPLSLLLTLAMAVSASSQASSPDMSPGEKLLRSNALTTATVTFDGGNIRTEGNLEQVNHGLAVLRSFRNTAPQFGLKVNSARIVTAETTRPGLKSWRYASTSFEVLESRNDAAARAVIHEAPVATAPRVRVEIFANNRLVTFDQARSLGMDMSAFDRLFERVSAGSGGVVLGNPENGEEDPNVPPPPPPPPDGGDPNTPGDPNDPPPPPPPPGGGGDPNTPPPPPPPPAPTTYFKVRISIYVDASMAGKGLGGNLEAEIEGTGESVINDLQRFIDLVKSMFY